MSDDPQVPLPTIASRSDFAAAVLWGVREATARQTRHLLWVDPDFADWPLDDPALLDALTPWVHRPQRRLVMLAQDWSSMRSRHARFCAWRQPYSHAIDPRTPDPNEAPALPTLVLDDSRICVRLNDRVHWRGRCSLDAAEVRLLYSEFDALAQRSTPDFAVNQIGL